MFQLECALDVINEKVKDIYKVDILAALMKIKNIWNATDASVIKNGWRHAKFCLIDSICLTTLLLLT